MGETYVIIFIDRNGAVHFYRGEHGIVGTSDDIVVEENYPKRYDSSEEAQTEAWRLVADAENDGLFKDVRFRVITETEFTPLDERNWETDYEFGEEG